MENSTALAQPDCEGIFHLLLSGRNTSVFSGYRPYHAIHTNYQTTGEHTYLDHDVVKPGESVRVAVRFITPNVYPQCIWEGRELTVQEGARIVGILKITSIANEALRVVPESFKPEWKEPPRLRHRQQ